MSKGGQIKGMIGMEFIWVWLNKKTPVIGIQRDTLTCYAHAWDPGHPLWS